MLFFNSKRSSPKRRNSAGERGKHGRRRAFERLEPRTLLTTVAGDFNHDGFADVAIGLPSDAVGSAANAGSVQVIYGHFQTGLNGATIQNWTQNSSGIAGTAENGDRFGAALAVGDFNKDGYTDLAIGAPGEALGSTDGAGAVHILLGSKTGLKSSGSQMWHQDSTGINGVAQANDGFGSALAVGDFNNDKFLDLAIGVPGETVSGFANAGAVNVIFGSSSGLKSSANQLWSQDVADIESDVATGDKFGAAVAAGDFNADGFTDLAVGAPGETVNSLSGAGGVNIIRGSKSGLTAAADQFWTAESTNIEGVATANGEFGFALATGDFNDDSFRDLAIGAPGENIGTDVAPRTSGAVHVMYSTNAGLGAANNQLWHGNRQFINTISPADGDRFGAALATGRFNLNRTTTAPFQDRTDDLAIGIPNQDLNATLLDAGAVRVLFGNKTSRLTTSGTQNIHQNISVVASSSAANEHFGASLAGGDFNHDGFVDLVVEVTGEAGGGSFTGAISALYGTNSNLQLNGRTQIWTRRASDGLLESPQEKNIREGQAFLLANRSQPGVVSLPSGLQYKVLTKGNGAFPTSNNQVVVNYTGTLIDGTEFDSGTDVNFSLQPGDLIDGFREALLRMRVGDKWRIFIPSALAYGEQGRTNIPPNSVLIFEIELLSIV